MGGHIDALLISGTLAVPQVTGKKVKALAVTSEKRLPQLPNVPTFAESGFTKFNPQQWTGLFVPAGTPPAIVSRIHAEFARALKSPEVIARAIVFPSAEIAQGYDATELHTTDGLTIQGLIIKQGDPVMIRSQGGVTQIVPPTRIASRQRMTRSLMLAP